jgi:hypothetical protein
LRVGLPTWFVQDVADWTQPQSTRKVHFSRGDSAVREMLDTIGWDPTEGDLPVAFREIARCTVTETDATTIIEHVINDSMPLGITRKLTGPRRHIDVRRTLFIWPHICKAVPDGIDYHGLNYGSEASYISLLDALSLTGKPRATHTYVVGHDNGVRRFSLVLAGISPTYHRAHLLVEDFYTL